MSFKCHKYKTEHLKTTFTKGVGLIPSVCICVTFITWLKMVPIDFALGPRTERHFPAFWSLTLSELKGFLANNYNLIGFVIHFVMM